MIPVSRNKTVAIALVAVIALAAGWWGYGEHQKRELRKSIVGLIADTGARMRAALTATDSGPEAARKFEEHSAAAEKNLSALKGMNASRETALAEAADDYLLTCREILKRYVNVQRSRQLLSESLPALIEHMRSNNRSGAWIQEAVKARERVNKDYRDLNLATNTLDTLLQSFPASQKKIAPYVDRAELIDDGTVTTARTRALDAAKQAAADLEKTRQLDAFR